MLATTTRSRTGSSATHRQLHRASDAEDADADDVTSEWYYDWVTLTPLLTIDRRMRESPVLDVGCGLSSLFSDLLASGFTGPFVGVDSSPSIIHQRRAQLPPTPPAPSPLPTLSFEQRDLFLFDAAFRASHPDEEARYGLVVDKATSDGMMCDDANAASIRRMYAMVAWSLRPGGTFLLVSVQEPDSPWCVDLLIPSLLAGSGQRHAFHVTCHTIASSEYYDGQHEGPNVYVCVKGERERRSRAAKRWAGADSADEVTVIQKFH